MGVWYESQVYAACELCSAYEFPCVSSRADFKKYLRAKGWTIGKKTICPGCNKKRAKGEEKRWINGFMFLSICQRKGSL